MPHSKIALKPQKTLLNVEGLGKQLYPQLDLWQTALPFLERWQAQRVSPLRTLHEFRDRLPQWIEQMPEVPELFYSALQNAARHPAEFTALNVRNRELEQRARRAERYAFMAVLGLVAALLAAALN